MNVREQFLAAVEAKFGPGKVYITRQEAIDVATESGLRTPQWLMNGDYTVSRGVYTLPAKGSVLASVENSTTTEMVGLVTPCFVPEALVGYVEFGSYAQIKKIVERKIFCPVYVTGLPGNGKTTMIEQVCASLGREYFRVNITIETEESDLIGGFRLVNGETVWQDGPVIQAMQRGAVLLLDEIDLGGSKIMCLQAVLEGKSVFIKKINRVVHPTKGFTIFATANTKGQGNDSGKFAGTNVMNDATLDRFSLTFEQEYPPQAVEQQILNNMLAKHNHSDPEFTELLCKWADLNRKAFLLDSISEVISTRRLINICEALVIFGDRKYALNLSLNRFNAEVKSALMSLYDSLDPGNSTPKEPVSDEPKDGDTIPF